MEIVKKHLYDILAVVMFAIISFVYFMPADIDGRILYRHDSSAGRGAGREATEYYEQTGERTRWSNSTFSGMPTYQTAPSYSSTDTLTTVMNAYHLWLPDNVWFLFAYLLGFYILLRAFDFRELLSVLGAIVWAFSSYFLIIIAAGHLWKVMALAYLPPMIAGVVLTYRGKYLWGFIVTAIFAAFEVKANHVQMTYYYLFVIALMIIAFLVQAVREKQLARFIKATSVCIAAAAIGICINFSNLYHTWQYSQESMRGKSELVKQNATNQTNSGLDRDYITQWSYGIGETWTLLVPNVKGGASVPLSQNPKAMAQADQQYMQIYQQLGQYWGEQPGTSGPVYVGAFVLMLFVLGLFIVKGPMKWVLLAATVLSILLSWGRNLMPFTDFFIDYVPMYSKFRTVSSILVIAEFTIPLLAMMALKKLIDRPEVLTRQVKYIYISYAFTGGVALLFALAPSLFFSDYVSSSEMEAMKSIPAAYLNPMLVNLKQMREAIFTADCWRSFWIVTLGTFCLLLFKARRLRAPWLISALIVLCLIDMWQVDKRYLNDGMFVERSARDMPQPMTATDKQILQDKNLDYRVLNLASNTFNENETSYYHKSIGGYHAAKLRRYQELIEAYIMPEMQQMMPAIIKSQGDMTRVNGDSLYPVLNMLNTKYIILPLQEGQTAPLQNPYTYGNAWFVDRISYVNNANEELDALRKIDLRHAAVADVKFKSQLGEAIQQDNVSMVKIKSYAPNRLSYDVTSDKGGILVFSEIYYPGWEATVDGQPAELGRVNYVLRAMHIQPGRHQVTLQFFPASIKKTETIAYISYAILILVILVGVFVDWKKRKQKL